MAGSIQHEQPRTCCKAHTGNEAHPRYMRYMLMKDLAGRRIRKREGWENRHSRTINLHPPPAIGAPTQVMCSALICTTTWALFTTGMPRRRFFRKGTRMSHAKFSSFFLRSLFFFFSPPACRCSGMFSCKREENPKSSFLFLQEGEWRRGRERGTPCRWNGKLLEPFLGGVPSSPPPH